MRCHLVPGTFSAYRGTDEREWWFPGGPVAAPSPASPFVRQVLVPLGFTALPLKWSSNLGGVRWWPWNWGRPDTHIDWRAAADNFVARLRYVPSHERVVISHSHGGNVMAYVAAQMPIRLWIDVASPVRLGDMADVYRRARANTEFWVHVHSDFSDRMQLLGAFFDGHFGFVRKNPYAHENVFVPNRGHSKVLVDESEFWFWRSSGITGHLTDCLIGRKDPDESSVLC